MTLHPRVLQSLRAAAVRLLTSQQLSERLGARGRDGKRELVHGDTVSDRQRVYLPVGNLAGQQLPQQHPEAVRRDDKGKLCVLVSQLETESVATERFCVKCKSYNALRHKGHKGLTQAERERLQQ